MVFCAVDGGDACGGPYTWAVYFARAMRDAGFEVIVLILCGGGKSNSRIARTLFNEGVDVKVLDSHAVMFIEDQTRWFVNQVCRYMPQIFIANLVLPALYAAKWLKSRGIRTVGVVHSDPTYDVFYDNMLRYFGNKENSFGLDEIVCVSEYIRDLARNNYQTTAELDVISCGTAMGQPFVEKKNGEIHLLYAGRLATEQKRIRELTEAFLAVTAIPGVYASICGNGPERSWLEARLRDQNRVRYLGNINPDQMQSVMRQHHAIVLLSDYEGLPMALIEGMACGLVPIVLDRPGGIREVVIDGVNGLIVCDRGQNFVEAVRRLTDEDMRARLSNEAVTTIARTYQHEVVFGQWTRLIRELSGGVKLSGRPLFFGGLAECREWFPDLQVMRPSFAHRAKEGISLMILRLRSRLKLRTKFRLFVESSNKILERLISRK